MGLLDVLGEDTLGDEAEELCGDFLEFFLGGVDICTVNLVEIGSGEHGGSESVPFDGFEGVLDLALVPEGFTMGGNMMAWMSLSFSGDRREIPVSTWCANLRRRKNSVIASLLSNTLVLYMRLPVDVSSTLSKEAAPT